MRSDRCCILGSAHCAARPATDRVLVSSSAAVALAARATPTRHSREPRARPGQHRRRRTPGEWPSRLRPDHAPVIELVVSGAKRRCATWRDAHLRSITPVRPARHAVEPADGDDDCSTSGVIGDPICGGDRMAGARRASDAIGMAERRFADRAWRRLNEKTRACAWPPSVRRGRGSLNDAFAPELGASVLASIRHERGGPGARIPRPGLC